MVKWIESIGKKIDPPVDYIGQHLANRIIHTMLLFGVIISLCLGHLYNDIYKVSYAYLSVCVFVLIVVTPSWPIFRRHPVLINYENKKKE